MLILCIQSYSDNKSKSILFKRANFICKVRIPKNQSLPFLNNFLSILLHSEGKSLLGLDFGNPTFMEVASPRS